MNINTARTLANINGRAHRITEDYFCTIFTDGVQVTHKDDSSRSYYVQNGVCSCLSFHHHLQCKHSIGIPALLEVEIARLKELAAILGNDGFLFRAAKWGEEILDAHMSGVCIRSYRAAMESED